jgi:hypothetical protein
MDLLSDMYMIYTYATTGKQGTALSLAVMVGLNILFQLWMTFLQTRRGPKLVMLKETLIVLSGMKPGWDAMNVANGTEQSPHAFMNPEMELTFTRCMEMCFESIPGSVVQISGILQNLKRDGEMSKVALGSVVLSALTTGFSGATISFE